MSRKYFGTDGIRGRVGAAPITADFVLRLGWAAGKVFGQRAVGRKLLLVGKDTRVSGYMFESALQAGLISAGVDVGLLGPMPTPAIAYLTRTFHAQAGIVISASHNPYYDNGIKFFGGDGRKLPDDVEEEIEYYLDMTLDTAVSDKLGRAHRIDDAAGRYIEFCKGTLPADFDLNGFKIVVDCANGATYHIAPHVFEELGAEVVAIGAKPNGLNINAGVGSTHIEALQRAVIDEQADLGVALDGDGDRLMMVDADGSVLDGDDILYIIACSRIEDGTMEGGVVGTKMTNLGLEHALQRIGLALERTDVGDRFIMARLQENAWLLGGEPSGHIICRDRTTTGDGIVSALQVMAAIYRSGKSLKELRSGMTKYPQLLQNVKLRETSADEIMASKSLCAALREVEAELGGTGRVLLRPSGTEPLIRVMIEGRDGEQVKALTRQLASVVEQLA